MQPGSEQFAWVALRSPVPNFAGRTPLPEDGDPETFDDTLPNPQSQLIFTPFGAQFDVDSRTDAGFQAGSVDVEKSFLAAVELGSQVCQQAYEDNRMAPEKWVQLCKRNLADWCGVGVRLSTR